MSRIEVSFIFSITFIQSFADIFLLQKSKNDWTHTGIIINAEDEILETIEGNTNEDGSRNGNRVRRRTRNFMKSMLDVFSVGSLL
jgi:hypothetical protein